LFFYFFFFLFCCVWVFFFTFLPPTPVAFSALLPPFNRLPGLVSNLHGIAYPAVVTEACALMAGAT
jgi:hypothetical protein